MSVHAAHIEVNDSQPPYVCWVVSDGRAGVRNQALGLAEAVNRIMPIQIIDRQARLKGAWRKMPRWLTPSPIDKLDMASDTFSPPFPDIWIGAGRQAVILSAEVKKASPETFVVQAQNPRASLRYFDLIIPPTHDGVPPDDKVFPILGAPNRLTSASLSQAGAAFAPLVEHLPKPRIAVLIGGPNSEFDFDDDDGRQIIQKIKELIEKGMGVMVTTSRRTPETFVKQALECLKASDCFFDGRRGIEGRADDAKPYPGLLSVADHVLVTMDSVNMMSEAASAGKPVQLIPLRKKNQLRFAQTGGQMNRSKFDRFRDDMRALDLVRPLNMGVEHWSPPAFDETERAARHIATRFEEHVLKLREKNTLNA